MGIGDAVVTGGISAGVASGTYVPTPALVGDGVTDNYAAIMNALHADGACVLPPAIGQYAVSAPILLPAGSGIQGWAVDTPAAATTPFPSTAIIVPTAGFNPALTTQQQAEYPLLGTTASAPIVHAGAMSWLRGVLVSGEAVCTSAVLLAAGQVSWSDVGALAGSACTVLDVSAGASPQGKWTGVTIRGTGALALELNSFDWLIDNLRVTSGSKILNCGGSMISTSHFTGAGAGETFNTQITAGLSFVNCQFDSGSVTDLVNITLGAANFPVQMTNVTVVNNSGADITNMFNNASGKAALNLHGLTMADFGTNNFGCLLASAHAGDRVTQAMLNASAMDTVTLAGLFPNGVPSVYDVVTF